MTNTLPSYLNLFHSGELKKRVEQAYNLLSECKLCPNQCKVDRFKKTGLCKSMDVPEVSSFNPHHGEEPPISGSNGSGTVFFTHCTMKCIFCQNYPISQLGVGKNVLVENLAETFLFLQNKKCHNLNLVTPTHFVPQFIKALYLAIEKGFSLPVVYNSSGYESIETLKLLDGIIDIYLPDMKYGSDENALQYSGIKNYVENNQITIREMFRQVGHLEKDKNDIAIKGLIIRHLVLPYNIAESKKILDFLKKEISTDVTIALMAQYFPAYKAVENNKLKIKITPDEYHEIINYAIELGFSDILFQEI